jgi:type IV pilus assembly protein PilO
MDLSELNELDINNIGDWPILVKAVAVVMLCVGIGAAWYYLDTSDQLVEWDKKQKEEIDLLADFERKQEKAANLEAYRQQLAEMEESFGAMLRQLPDKTQVADLLVDVSQTGLAAGLEFELFQPQAEERKDFYAELPISIRVRGTYHRFGEFISGIAALPRIVTVHDVQITPQGGASGGRAQDRAKLNNAEVPLSMVATAKTYRYLEEQE